MRNLITRQMSLITNVVCLILVGLGQIPSEASAALTSMGLFGLSGALTNWLAIHMLFEKVPGLYGSGIIPNKFEAFKVGIENMIMQQFFTKQNLERFLQEQLSSKTEWEIEPLLAEIDYDLLFEKLSDAVESSPFGQMLQMFGGRQALTPLKEPFQEKLQEVVRDLLDKPSFLGQLETSLTKQINPDTILSKIDVIVKTRLDELTPSMVKEIVQEMIRQHLGWLVVWGGFFGSLIGLIASFFD